MCAHPQLAADDVKLAVAYKAALGVYAGADRLDLQRSQRDWLRARVDACTHVDATLEACLAGLYDDRAKQLEALRTSPNAGLATLLWTDGVACEGDRALVRFSQQNEDGSLAPPPEVGGAPCISRASAFRSAMSSEACTPTPPNPTRAGFRGSFVTPADGPVRAD